jgi:hypothetical protein
MADMRFSSMSSVIELSLFMQVDNGVSRKDASNTR